MASAAVSNDGLVIPVLSALPPDVYSRKHPRLTIELIDFSKFLTGSSDDRAATAKSIVQGFKTAGFVYLRNHGVDPAAVRRTFELSALFFRLPLENKLALEWDSPASNRGYSSQGREKTSVLVDADAVARVREAVPDLKESYEIGNDGDAVYKNKWPAESANLDGFREQMVRFFGECHALNVEVMNAIAAGMGLEGGFFNEYINGQNNTLRLLHYPEATKDVFRKPGQVRAGEHTDYGSITLLFQDSRGGLQVKSPQGTFVNATPIEGTIVVNAGDLLARWSNDAVKSTLHRVVEPPVDEESHPARYSIAYFCNPNADAFIETLPGTYESGGKLYEGVRTDEYLERRLAATY